MFRLCILFSVAFMQAFGCTLGTPADLASAVKRGSPELLGHPREYRFGDMEPVSGMPVETTRPHEACKLNPERVRLAWLDEDAVRDAFGSVAGFPGDYEAIGHWLIEQAAYLTRVHKGVSQAKSDDFAVHDDLTQNGMLDCSDTATKTGRYGLYTFKRELVFPVLAEGESAARPNAPVIGARGAGRTDENNQPGMLATPRFQEPVINNTKTWHSTGLMTLAEAIRAVVMHRVLSKLSVWAQDNARPPLDELRVAPVFAILELGFDIQYSRVGGENQRAAMLLYAPVPRATALQKQDELRTNWSPLFLFDIALQQTGLGLSVANLVVNGGSLFHMGVSDKSRMNGLWVYDFNGFTPIEPSFESTVRVGPPQIPKKPWREQPRTTSSFDQAAIYSQHTARAFLRDAPHDIARARSYIYEHITRMAGTLEPASGWPDVGEKALVKQASGALNAEAATGVR